MPKRQPKYRKISPLWTMEQRIAWWKSRSVVTDRGCWEWQGCLHKQGYGQVGHQGATVLLHKLIWEYYNDPTPTGKELDHTCQNPPCWNPDHLEPVTHLVNIRRGRGTGWTATHCKQGHAFTVENIVVSRRENGSFKRTCRTCTNLGQRKRALLKKQAA